MEDQASEVVEAAMILSSLTNSRRKNGVRRNKNLKKYITGYYPSYKDLIKECSICLNNPTRGRIVYVVNCCKKEYHRSCLEAWLKISDKCPLCRGKIRDGLN